MALLAPSTADVPEAAAESWVIEPRGKSPFSQLREVWAYRRLFSYFGKRSVQRRYRNTVLGPAWLIIRPVLPIAIRTLVFGGVLGVDSPGVPYFLFTMVGSSVWDLFSGCLMWSTRSLQMNRGFIGRLYFPRVIVPAATMALALVNFLIMLGIMGVALAYYYYKDGQLYLAGPSHLPWALAAVVMAVTLAFSVGLWTSPIGAQYRDVRFTLSYILEFWSLLTPVMYPLSHMLSRLPPKYHWVVFLNPLAGVVQAFKWGFLGIEELNVTAFVVDVFLTLLVLLSGLWYFSRVEGQAIDRS
jgi:lipopolysaccharide transport system permease protein